MTYAVNCGFDGVLEDLHKAQSLGLRVVPGVSCGSSPSFGRKKKEMRGKEMTASMLNPLLIASFLLTIALAVGAEEKSAEFNYKRGFEQVEKDQFDQAIAEFNKDIELNPRDALAYSNRGAAFLEKGQHDRAITDLNKAIELNPRLAIAYSNRGFVHIKKRQYAHAIADCNKALEINPRLAEAYFNRGVAYFNMKDFEKAWKDLHKTQSLGLKVDPGFLESLRKASGSEK